MEARWLQQLHPRGCVFSPTCSRSLGAIVFTVSWVVPIPGQLLRPGKCSVWFGLGTGGRGRFPHHGNWGTVSVGTDRGCWGGSALIFFFGRVCCYAAVFVAMWASVVAACGLSSYRARPQVPLCNWNPPGSGIESMSSAGGFITTGPPRKSCPLTAVQVSPSPLASLCSVRHLPALS